MSAVFGINHMFLFPEAITNEKAHTESLKKMVKMDGFDAMDVWVWRGEERSKEEIKILRDSGKIINYNVGDRYGEEKLYPSSTNKKEQQRAYDTNMREIGYALEIGSKKIVIGSGPDEPNDREDAKERFGELIHKLVKELPSDVTLALEPTDRDLDKYFLFGPVEETAAFIKKMRREGASNLGMLLDMGHIPLVHETLESALDKAEDALVHIHLGNALISDKNSPYFGDRHIPWNYPGGEYTTDDGVRFIKLLKKKGYFDKTNATATVESRPMVGLTEEESVKLWIKLFNEAYNA